MIHELMYSLIFFVIENSRLKCICDIAIKHIFLFNDKVINQQRKIKILKRWDKFRSTYLLVLNIADRIPLV